MKKIKLRTRFNIFLSKIGINLKGRIVAIFLLSTLIPMLIVSAVFYNQIASFGDRLKKDAVLDSATALNEIAMDNIERMTTDTANRVADFLYARDADIKDIAARTARLDFGQVATNDAIYKDYIETRTSRIIQKSEWVLNEDKSLWVQKDPPQKMDEGWSDNDANNDGRELIDSEGNSMGNMVDDGFHAIPGEEFVYRDFALYDELAFLDLNGQQIFKAVADPYSDDINKVTTTKINSPSIKQDKLNIAQKETKTYQSKQINTYVNTFIKAETYWEELKNLAIGEIYVSDVIGAYVGTNYIGMYTPKVLEEVAGHPNQSELNSLGGGDLNDFFEEAKRHAYSGQENPLGIRFEGIVRWAMPVAVGGNIVGYVTLALNHDHIMELVDHITPMPERYTEIPSAFEGNYAFIWDYQCRNIVHPRHHSIVGYNPYTGQPQVPWIEGTPDRGEETAFAQWMLAGGDKWLQENESWHFDDLSPTQAQDAVSWYEFYIENSPGHRQKLADDSKRGWSWGYPDGWFSVGQQFDYKKYSLREFTQQERVPTKTPAAELTKRGFVGLDGRFLNNAPQCTGWMDLTENGGSGSFYILWSGIYKPTTAAAIRYYTGQYSPEIQNNYRGFGIVTIGADIDAFEAPAHDTADSLAAIVKSQNNKTLKDMAMIVVVFIIFLIIIALLVSLSLIRPIREMIAGISRFKTGERQFRFNPITTDEFGHLAESFDQMADSIVSSVSGPMAILDKNRNVIYMNDIGLERCKKTLKEVVGTAYSTVSIYPTDPMHCPICALEKGYETEAIYLSDENIYYKGTASYLLDKDGNKNGYIVASTDVTEVERAREKAENASKAKSDFLSKMSHEIRTPLNAIVGMTAIGQHADDTERKDYCFDKINMASTHLLGVINDILDISKIEANKFELSATEFNFEKMLQTVVNVINYRMDEKNQKFSVFIDDDIPKNIISDEQRLAQVITNLLSNAVKFTPEEGKIYLKTRLISKDAQKAVVQISVTDTGIGMKREEIGRVFNSFEQAENSTSRKFGGTGLGLAISKNIIEKMDGKIWVESEYGIGSSFVFNISVGYLQDTQLLPKKVLQARESLKILVVDDSPELLDYFSIICKQIGLKCDTALSGFDALKLMENNDYDICFIDYRMPKMDGIELSNMIRQNGKSNSIIIMISAADWTQISAKARQAGVDKFLPKPLFPSAIAEIVDSCLGLNKSATAQDDNIESFDGYKILLAEDVEINKEIVFTLLEPTGIDITWVENGELAVKEFAENPDKYDLILMDLQMPEMDGLEASKRIRAMDGLRPKTIPIIAMTANVFKEDIDKCKKAGMNDHLGKPLDIALLIQTLKQYLKK